VITEVLARLLVRPVAPAAGSGSAPPK
jgi:hypothetical protein